MLSDVWLIPPSPKGVRVGSRMSLLCSQWKGNWSTVREVWLGLGESVCKGQNAPQHLGVQELGLTAPHGGTARVSECRIPAGSPVLSGSTQQKSGIVNLGSELGQPLPA